MRITLVRHAETPGNVAGRLDTAPPGPDLTDRGRTQAAALVDRFQGEPFDTIWTSAHLRARRTAAPLAAEREITPTIRPTLGEFSAGDLEGRNDAAALAVFLDVMHGWIGGDLDPTMPGGESGHDLMRRLDAAMAEIAASRDDTALVVSHGGVLRIWAAQRCGNVTTEFALANYLVNTGVIVVTGSPTAGWHCESWDLAPGQH
jgi:broad specificity phosphatase PhoE